MNLQDMDAAAAIAACEDTEAFDGLLEALPDAQREVLRLRFVADLSIAETARCMARSEGAIKALQTRALNTLRQSGRGVRPPGFTNPTAAATKSVASAVTRSGNTQ